MAFLHDTVPAPRMGGLLLSLLTAPFAALGRGLVSMMDAHPRVREVEHLRNLSDAELAARGLTREGIVHHVFRDQFYV